LSVDNLSIPKDHSGRAHNPRFSVTTGTNSHQHCGFAGSNGSLSIICMVNRNAGIAQSYSKIKSLQSKVVGLVIDYYETTLEIEGSAQVWGRNFIVSLSPTRVTYRSPGGLVVMHEMVDRGAIVQFDNGGWDGISEGCVKPEDK